MEEFLTALLVYLSVALAGVRCGGNPGSWPEKRVLFQAGERQSPVDINSRFVISKDLPILKFINHDTDCSFIMYNDGHTLKVRKNDTRCRPELVGGPLGEAHILDSIHFHWDVEGEKGSEHTVDGYRYDGEAHAVYFNSKYRTMDAAKKKCDGLAVVGFFLEEGSRPNVELQSLLKHANKVWDYGTETGIDGEEALGWAEDVSQQREYYTYPGSLTTPPYSENVVFMIFPYPISVCKKKLNYLRAAKTEKGHLIAPNWREVQPLHKRFIVHSYNQI